MGVITGKGREELGTDPTKRYDDTLDDIRVVVKDVWGEVLGKVRLSGNLDTYSDANGWCHENKPNWHKGITRMKDGQFVIMFEKLEYNKPRRKSRRSARAVPADEALKHILASGRYDLLDMDKYKELKWLLCAEAKERMNDCEILSGEELFIEESKDTDYTWGQVDDDE